MRSRDLIDGFDYGEYMQRQMFCFGSDDDGGDTGPTGYSGSDIDFDSELDVSGLAGPSTSGSTSGSGSDGYDTISRATAKDYGVSSPTKGQIEQARGFDFGSDASDALIAQIQGGYGGSILGDQYAGSGIENQRFFDQLPGRLANAQAGYGLPGFLGTALGAIGTSQLNRMKGQVLGGGIPAFDATGNFQGVFSKGLFGGDVYTGMPIEGNELTGWSPDDDQRDGTAQTIKPVNPVTGQCDEGYIFDEDLQACRLDTRAGAEDGGAGSVVPPTPGGYARMGLLDVAPTGLGGFAQRYGTGFGTPSDFTAANLAFRQQGATYPEYFKRPPRLDGYTLLS